MASRFDKFLQTFSPVDSELPLTHATDAFTLREVMDTDKLRAGEGSVFKGDRILYFFVGRAAYRPNAGEPPNALVAYAPVCFILTPTSLNEPKRVFPFDSGAFDDGIFNVGLHHRMQIEDFELDPKNQSARRLISVYFGSNLRYIQNKPFTEIKIPGLEFEAQSFHKLITSAMRSPYDNRVSAIEFQVDEEVNVMSALQALILPSDLLDEGRVRTKIQDWGAEPLPYDWTALLKPTEHMSTVANIARDYLKARLHHKA